MIVQEPQAGIPWLARMRAVLPPPRPVSFIPYEVPVGPGVRARLVLPAGLTDRAAERLCGVIRAVAFPDQEGQPR